MIKLTDEEVARFWRLVDRSGGPRACWPWRAHLSCGYGQFSIRRGKVKLRAHRVAAFLAGIIPTIQASARSAGDDLALHSCDNSACCNYAHLERGTNAKNIADRVSRGRGARTIGTTNGRALLTEAEVIEARRTYAAGGVTQPELAARFGTSRSAMNHLLAGRSWGHL